VGRTDAIARFPEEVLLHHPVLERVKGDDREAATGPQDGHGGLEAALQIPELVIHRDAQRLEDARRRIDSPRSLRLHAEDETTEIVGRHEWLACTPPHDGRSDAAGLRLLAELGEDATQLDLTPGVHDVRRRDAASVWIGAHVQRACGAKAEAALSVGELDRREAEVEKDPLERDEVVLPCHVVENREVGADEGRPIAESRENATSFGESCRIDIKPEKAAGRRGPLEDGLGMASRTDRAVEEAATFAGIKLGEYFGQKNRLMKPPTFIVLRPRDP
jgi:hypothetical protein